MSNKIWQLSATQLAEQIRQRNLSSREIVRAHLDRIESINSSVNAITCVLAETALADADVADRALATNSDVGPLHGVPITVKENIDVLGSATTNGVCALAQAMPSADAPVIGHLKAAGAIILGRTNMPDFGMRWHTDNDLHGPTINPWIPNRTPGGSSGGEAAALATGMSPLGIGNDMGGSTRQPAVNCGVMGLRPTTGRVSRTLSTIFESPPLYYEQIACVNGPMARSVDDLQLALSVMQQPDLSDPIWTPSPISINNGEEPCRIGLIRDPWGDGLSVGVAQALDAAAETLRQSGYLVEDIEAPCVEDADKTIQELAVTEIAKYFGDIKPMISRDAVSVLTSVLGDQQPDAAIYRDAIATRHTIIGTWSQVLIDYPIILGPVSTMDPFVVGFDTEGPDAMRQLIRSFWLTELCNLLGLPSLALPLAVHDGMPMGVQLIARHFEEERIFNAARVIETSYPLSTPIDAQRNEKK